MFGLLVCLLYHAVQPPSQSLPSGVTNERGIEPVPGTKLLVNRSFDGVRKGKAPGTIEFIALERWMRLNERNGANPRARSSASASAATSRPPVRSAPPSRSSRLTALHEAHEDHEDHKGFCDLRELGDLCDCRGLVSVQRVASSEAARSTCAASLSMAETTMGMYFFGSSQAFCSMPSRIPGSVLTP
jgi:hypothetical protein